VARRLIPRILCINVKLVKQVLLFHLVVYFFKMNPLFCVPTVLTEENMKGMILGKYVYFLV
jgi:hypothetical protein